MLVAGRAVGVAHLLLHLLLLVELHVHERRVHGEVVVADGGQRGDLERDGVLVGEQVRNDIGVEIEGVR